MPRTASSNFTAAATLLALDNPDLTPADLAAFLSQRQAAAAATTGTASAPGKLLTVRAVAERLGMGQRTIWRWQKEGTIPCVRMGRSVRFREADIVRLARQGVRPSATAATTSAAT